MHTTTRDPLYTNSSVYIGPLYDRAVRPFSRRNVYIYKKKEIGIGVFVLCITCAIAAMTSVVPTRVFLHLVLRARFIWQHQQQQLLCRYNTNIFGRRGGTTTSDDSSKFVR